MTSGLLAERNGRYGMSESAKASTSMERASCSRPAAAKTSAAAAALK